jgi:phosphopantetheinyl transferase (holo-ACP synthase)
MAFIGNDIVDLTDPDNIGKSRDQRFLQRVFTEAERACIAAAAEPDVILWALWAAKETAYKIASKIDILAVFIPRLYAVALSPGDHGVTRSGRVETPQGPVVIRVAIAPDHLHCIGATPLPGILDHVLWDIERLCRSEEDDDRDPSMAVRRLAGRRLAAMLDTPVTDIDIRRFNDIDRWGPPSTYIEGQPAPFDLSLSHDGAFIACAMVPTTGEGMNARPDDWA